MTEHDIKELDSRLTALEKRIPNSGIVHPNLWRRVVTVLGYSMVPIILLSLAVTVYVMIFFGVINRD